jgi:signal transduction histidine kinase
MAVLAALIGLGLTALNPSPVVAAIAATIAIGAAAVLIWRPGRFLLLPAALATAGIGVLGNGNSTNLGWFAVCVIGVWCALFGGRRGALIYWAGSVALFAAEWLWVNPDRGWGAWMAGSTLAVGLGLLIRHERELVTQLRAAQAGLADRARSEERNRIARDLHDVIGHTLAVSLLHVTSARLAVEHNLADAARALAEAERLGRDSLDEVRLVVGMLHKDENGGPMPPPPTAQSIPALVEQFRAAGADAVFVVDGDTSRLPATSSLALYRILQEALTNAIRHAPGRRINVHLRAGADAVQLSVETAGAPGTGSGLGLMSMRERASSLGGRCEAGPGGTGWLVTATLPADPGRRRDGAA